VYSSVKRTTEDKLSTTDILRGIIAALATLCALAILPQLQTERGLTTFVGSLVVTSVCVLTASNRKGILAGVAGIIAIRLLFAGLLYFGRLLVGMH
jgi:hypothetical protein